jgi:peptidoglycan DL-endopeptidase CwlO
MRETREVTLLVHLSSRRALATATSSTTPSHRSDARRPSIRTAALNMAVMAVATGMVATLALPGTSLRPLANAEPLSAAQASDQRNASATQRLNVLADSTADASRDDFTATTEEELAAARAAAEAEQRRAEAAAAAATAAAAAAARPASRPTATSSTAGTTSAAGTTAPRTATVLPRADLGAIANLALRFQGVPYLLGGRTPAGFDCSGFILYVYAQFGISLPHGVSGQAASGTRISRADARPGDLVIFNDHSHNGIYLGNGTMIDSPRPGKSVQVRTIWTDAYYIVRIGG